MSAPSNPLDLQVARVVEDLHRVASTSNLEHALESGRVIVHHIFEDNLELVRAEGATRPAFRLLVAHRNLPRGLRSEKALWLTVQMVELAERHGEELELSSMRHIGPSHIRTVLGLPPEDELRLLLLAEADKWTVVAIETQANLRRPPSARARGRPRATVEQKIQGRLHRALARIGRDIEALQENDPRAATHARNAVRRVLCSFLSRLEATADSCVCVGRRT
jgi:hypothetical protein